MGQRQTDGHQRKREGLREKGGGEWEAEHGAEGEWVEGSEQNVAR